MKKGFTFAGKSTNDFHMTVEHPPAQKAPERKRTTFTVPGRNGDLHYDEGAYENYTQSYECGFRGKKPTAELAHAIKQWLCLQDGYQRLEDSYDTTHFRLASFAGPMDIENQLNRIGKCTVNFDCAPQAYLIEGEQPVTLTAAETLNNARFPAKPLIQVFGSGDGTLTVGSVTVTITGLSDWIMLDCETLNAYRETVNCNSMISASEFPVLEHGDNAISWAGGITKIIITPRWWEL